MIGNALRLNPLSLLPLVAASSPERGSFFVWRYSFRLKCRRYKLPLRGSWHRAAMTERVYDPFCKKVAQKRPQAFLSHKL